MPSVLAYTLENAIYTLAVTTPDIVSAVTGRIYSEVAPQDTSFPYLCYTVVSDEDTNYMSGDSGLSKAQLQIDVYSLSSGERGAIANLVKATFGVQIGEDTDPIQIESMLCHNNRRSSEGPKNAGDSKIYRSMLEFEVWYRDPVSDGVTPVNNNLLRAYTYPNPATFPSTPQAYSMQYYDSDGVLWYCQAGSTTWTIVNTVG